MALLVASEIPVETWGTMMGIDIHSLFFEEMEEDQFEHNGVRIDERANGRVLFAHAVLGDMVKDPRVHSFTVYGGVKGELPAGIIRQPITNVSVRNGGLEVWFEPARHYWWKPTLIRRALGGSFPIVTMMHAVGYADQVGSDLACMAIAPSPADTVIAPSLAAARSFTDRLHSLFDACRATPTLPRVVVVPYGVDEATLRHLPRDEARRWLAWDVQPVAVFIGRVSSADKGDFRSLVQAVAEVKRRGVQLKLCVAGVGTEEDVSDILRLSTEAGLTDVDVRRNVTEEYKAALMSGADVFVSPSNTISESFGLTVVEAMFHAAPIVCSAWSGYRELINHGTEGWLVPLHWQRTFAVRDEVAFVSGVGPLDEVKARMDVRALADCIEEAVVFREEAVRRAHSAQVKARREFTLTRCITGIVDVMLDSVARAAGVEKDLVPRWAPNVLGAFQQYAAPGRAFPQCRTM